MFNHALSRFNPSIEDTAAMICTMDRKLSLVEKIENIQLELTNFCNLKCPYCCSQFREEGYVANNVINHKQIDIKMAKKISEQAEEMSCKQISFVGYGEPTVHKEWVNIVRYFIEKDIQTSIITNLAKMFTEEEIDAFSYMNTLWVSIDTVDKNVFSELRDGHKLDTFFRNLSKIRAKNKKNKIIANSVMCNMTCTKIEELYQRMIDHGVDVLSLLPLGTIKGKENIVTKNENSVKSLYYLTEKEKKNVLERIQRLEEKAQKDTIKLYIHPLIMTQLGMLKPGEMKQNKKIISCVSIFDTAYIDCSGNMLLCCAESIRTGKTLGNIQHSSLKKLFNEKIIQHYRMLSLQGNLPTGCMTCCQYRNFSSVEEVNNLIFQKLNVN